MLVREIRETYAYRNLISLLVRRDLKNRYRDSILGLGWAILHPLIYMIILNFVFSYAFKRGDTNFALYVLSGVLFWIFFSSGTVGGMGALNYKKSIIKKIPVKKNVFIIGTVMVSMVNWMLGISALIVVGFALGHHIDWTFLWLPIVLFSSGLYIYGISLALSILSLRYRDLQHLYTAALTLFMYMTPLFYPLDIVPQRFMHLYLLNPNVHFVEAFRYCYFGSSPLGHQTILISAVVGFVVFVFGLIIFRRQASDVVFYL